MDPSLRGLLPKEILGAICGLPSSDAVGGRTDFLLGLEDVGGPVGHFRCHEVIGRLPDRICAIL